MSTNEIINSLPTLNRGEICFINIASALSIFKYTRLKKVVAEKKSDSLNRVMLNFETNRGGSYYNSFTFYASEMKDLREFIDLLKNTFDFTYEEGELAHEQI